ncbi:MAG: sporulation initiation inhibitor Soj [Planctomycetota bacterium]|nr:MAG: sporulation initiation inhibitor Soj [Planctomycetota bacterium]
MLVVDLDPQGNQADFFGVRQDVLAEKLCVGNVLMEPGDLQRLQHNIISVDRPNEGLSRPNLYLLPASRNLEDVTQDLVVMTTMRTARRSGFSLDTVLADALGPLLGRFDFIVMDCPPKLDTLKRAVYNFADEVIVPVKADHVSLVGARQHTDDLYALQREDSRRFKARVTLVVPTMMPSRQVLASQVVEQMQTFYGRDLVSEPVPESVYVKEAPAAGGQTLFEYAPSSAPSKAYASIVERVFNG